MQKISYTGALSGRRGRIKAALDLDSVRDGRLWNVTPNLLRTTSLKFLSVLKSPGLRLTRILSEELLMTPQR